MPDALTVAPDSPYPEGDRLTGLGEGSQRGLSFEVFLNEVDRYPLLTAAEEVELAKQIERGDTTARERLVVSNLRLVVSIAKRYETRGVALGDLVQDGVIGLIHATAKFDWRRGLPFSIYVSWWIRQAVQRGISNRGWPIRVPVDLMEHAQTVKHTERELLAKLGRQPTEEELAPVAKLTLRQLERVRADWAIVSPDEPADHIEGRCGDVSPTPLWPPLAEDETDAVLLEDAVRRAVKTLTTRQRLVITLRFGLHDNAPLSLEMIAKMIGTSRKVARQIESDALRRLAEDAHLSAAQ